MFASGFESTTNQQENLRQKFAQLREEIHRAMKVEETQRLKENPTPSEEELHMGAFREWLEPQVRTAVEEMFRKGYATQSSGFHGEECEMQMIDGWFTIDSETKERLSQIGVEVLRGADIGLPKNKMVGILRFRARRPEIGEIKAQWDTIAALLPEKTLPQGIRPMCDRAEEFRERFAPGHPSLEEERNKYLDYIRTVTE